MTQQNDYHAGAKYDAGKPRWDLLPWSAVEQVVRVLDYGAAKYGEHSWRSVPHGRTRYFAALMRHMLAWFRGEALDDETRMPHLAHAACNVLFLLELDTGTIDLTHEEEETT